MTSLRQKLLVAFAHERAEHLQCIRTLLQSVEPEMDELFRRAHTLKGAASALGWTAGEQLAECLETAFQKPLDCGQRALALETVARLESDDPEANDLVERWRPPAPVSVADFFWEVAGYALSSTCVERVFQVEASAVQNQRGRAVLLLEGGAVSVLPLSQLLGEPTSAPRSRWPAMLLRHAGRSLVLLLTEIPRRLRQADGRPVLAPSRLLRARRASNWLEPRAGARILVVDDSPTTRTLQREILESHGYQVVLAGDGLEALSVLKNQSVDLILTDLQMPRLDGFGLIQRLQAHSAWRQLPVVLVSSLDRPADLAVAGYLNKRTFSQAELLSTVAGLCQPPAEPGGL